MAENAPKGPWAWAQLVLAIATVLWAVALWLYPATEGAPAQVKNIAVTGVNAAAGLFFFVAFILITRSHPDARIVAFFGLAMFLAANLWYAHDLYDVKGDCLDALGNAQHDCYVYRDAASQPDWMGGKVGVVAGVTAIGGILEAALLVTMSVWSRRERRRLEDERRDAEEQSWNRPVGPA